MGDAERAASQWARAGGGACLSVRGARCVRSPLEAAGDALQ